jgi:hypothetical protein
MIKAVFLNFVAYDENTPFNSLSSLVVKDFFKEKISETSLWQDFKLRREPTNNTKTAII